MSSQKYLMNIYPKMVNVLQKEYLILFHALMIVVIVNDLEEFLGQKFAIIMDMILVVISHHPKNQPKTKNTNRLPISTK